MSDDLGNGGFVLHWLPGRYAEVHISWENCAQLLDFQYVMQIFIKFFPQHLVLSPFSTFYSFVILTFCLSLLLEHRITLRLRLLVNRFYL